jgi:hypothetical protein
MMRWSALPFLLLLAPALAFAQIGFPDQSVWLSDTKPEIGEKIRIYAVVYNSTDAASSGTLTFLVDGKENGSKSITLESGESTVVASPWTATEGTHTFAARFQGSGDGAAIETGELVKVSVAAPPSAVEQTLEDAKNAGSQIASVSIPIVSTVANTVFDTTESIREAGLAYLEDKVSATEASGTEGTVLGTTTAAQAEGFEAGNAHRSGISGIIASATHAASVGALAIFRSLWLFYPVFVGLLLLIARWLYKWVTRPRF